MSRQNKKRRVSLMPSIVAPQQCSRILLMLWMVAVENIMPVMCAGQAPCQSLSQRDEDEAVIFSTPYTPIPDEWIAKVRDYDGIDSPTSLVEEFSRIMHRKAENSSSTEGYFNPLFVNLDPDRQIELVAFIGWSYDTTQFCVFKQIENVWRLLYIEDVAVHYEEPSLVIANTRSPWKVFYIRQLYDRGTGIYKDKYHVFRLINQTVYPCLQIVKEAHLAGWPPVLIGEHLYASLTVTGEDTLKVQYTYHFFPDMGLLSRMADAIQRHAESTAWLGKNPEAQDVIADRLFEQHFTLIDDDDIVYYTWNPQTHQYTFDRSRYGHLDACKVARFGDFENHALFLDAFAQELRELHDHGTPDEQLLLKTYFEAVEEQ